jgi:hypothetical protein
VRGPHTYRFIVRGRPSDRLDDLIEEMAIRADGDQITVTGTIIDQSHLRGVLSRIADLGFQVVSFERLGAPPAAPAAADDH